MNSRPLVSVYLPTHNRADLVGRAIRSVLEQSYDHLEVLVVDDGSRDETPRVIAEYLRDSRVRSMRQDVPGGACAARNRAIFQARGELITGIDDDDEFTPDRVEKLVKGFDPDGASFAYTDLLTVSARSRRRVRFSGRVDLDDILYRNVVGSQVLTLTERLQGIGGFDESLEAMQDYDAWIRLVARYGVATKVSGASYLQHVEHEGERISVSPRVRHAAYRVYWKHRDLMSRRHRKYRLYRLSRLFGRTLPLARFVSMAGLVQPLGDYKGYVLQRAQRLRRNA